MDAVSDLRANILSFVDGQMSRAELSHWVIDSLLDLEQSEDPAALRQFDLIAGILAEASHAQWGEETLRHELANAASAMEQPSTIS